MTDPLLERIFEKALAKWKPAPPPEPTVRQQRKIYVLNPKTCGHAKHDYLCKECKREANFHYNAKRREQTLRRNRARFGAGESK